MPPCSDWPSCAPPRYLPISFSFTLSACVFYYNRIILKKQMFSMCFSLYLALKKERGWRKTGKEVNNQGEHADSKSRHKSAPRKRPLKKMRQRKEVEGFKAWLKFPETQEKKRCACVRVFACARLWSALGSNSGEGTPPVRTRPPVSFSTLVSVCPWLAPILGSMAGGGGTASCLPRQAGTTRLIAQ